MNRAIVRCIINFPFASTVLSRYEDDARGTSRSLNGLNFNFNLNETVRYIFGSPFVSAVFFQLLLRCCRYLQRDLLWLVAVACPLPHSHSLAIAAAITKEVCSWGRNVLITYNETLLYLFTTVTYDICTVLGPIPFYELSILGKDTYIDFSRASKN